MDPCVRRGAAEFAYHKHQQSGGSEKEDVQFGVKRQFTAEDFLFRQIAAEIDVLHLELFPNHQRICVVSEMVKRGGSLFYERFSHSSTIPFDKLAAETAVLLYQKPRVLSIIDGRHDLVNR